jgi:hypothetical protein
MQVYATLLPSLPLYGNTRVDVGLMYDLWYQLCSIIDKVRARRRNLRAVDGISRTIFEEEAYEGGEGIEEEADNEEVDDQEDDSAAAHPGN